ncbi:MAG: NAD-dependent protein deacylase [Phototrophicales bacterium]|nr:MAG: NAD-dependent protein deacylase [Phototrophicales bacterium]
MSANDEVLLDEFARIIANSTRLAVSTGAGISKESGIPTFRDAMDGLWARYDPEELATPSAFQRNPKLVWDWYTYRRELINAAQPNAAHYALVELENLLPQVVIITQNVDGFHDKVGNRNVIHLHGNIHRTKCADACKGEPTYIDLSQIEWNQDAGPPLCPYCKKAYARPDVVWFTEPLPSDALRQAYTVSRKADVMLVIGTSGLVQPAASLPFLAAEHGAKILEINPNPSTISNIATIRLEGGAAIILPKVVKRVRAYKKNSDE